MERFIVHHDQQPTNQLSNLKSSMERFIVEMFFAKLVLYIDLKSSMERFIVNAENFKPSIIKFKIQYGEIYSFKL